MAILFVARGLFLLSVLPPLEGWDEYQHIAYIEFLLERGRAPVLGSDEVPASLHRELVQLPHGRLALQQLASLGAVFYDDYWQTGPPVAPAPGVRLHLYQAQHSPFYYRLVAPLYAAAKDRFGFRGAIATLRLLNVAFGAIAVYVALWSIGRLVAPGTLRIILGLLIAAQPLYLLNCARVANDALALLLGTCAVAWLLLIGPRRLYASCAAIGLILGLAILGKTINFGLLPLVIFVFAHMAWRRIIVPRQAAAAIAIVLLATATITFSYVSFNLRTFGLLTPMQEAVKNRAEGRRAADMLAAASDIDWYAELSRRILRQSLWTAGWSYLSPNWSAARESGWPILSDRWPVRLHEWIAYAAMAGALLLLWPRYRANRWILTTPGAGWRTAVMALGLTAGLSYHMLQTQLALGSVATNIWYGCIAFPWVLMLLMQGLAGLPGRRTATVLAVALLIVFVSQEFYGTAVQMSRHYYGASIWSPTALRRANLLSPAFPRAGATGYISLAAAWLLIATALAMAFKSPRPTTPPQSPTPSIP